MLVPAVLAESLLKVGPAVSVGVAQSNDPAWCVLLVTDCHEDVAVRGHVQVPRRTEAVRDDKRAEPVWKLDAAVVGVTFKEGHLLRAARGREGDRRRQGESERTEDRESHGSSLSKKKLRTTDPTGFSGFRRPRGKRSTPPSTGRG